MGARDGHGLRWRLHQLVLKGEGENIVYDDPLFGPTQAYQTIRKAIQTLNPAK